MSRAPLSVIIPTLNEEANLPDCLHSVVGWCDQAIVVDSDSRDRTQAVARDLGAEVLVHGYDGPAEQKNWALDHPSLRNPWVLFLDADERVLPELACEIRRVVAQDPPPFLGYHVNRRFIFHGRWMRHSWYPSWNVRLVRRGRARYEARSVHEHMLVDGPVGFLQHDLLHNDFRDMDHWIATHNRYAEHEATELLQRRAGVPAAGLPASPFGGPLERRRWLKNVLWPRLPARGFLLFCYLYFAKRGFLDGAEGLQFCIMHGIFEHFISAKEWEKTRRLAGPVPNRYREALAAWMASHPESASDYPG